MESWLQEALRFIPWDTPLGLGSYFSTLGLMVGLNWLVTHTFTVSLTVKSKL